MSFINQDEQNNQITEQKNHIIIGDAIPSDNKKECNSINQKSTQSHDNNDDDDNTLVVPNLDGRRAWIVLGGFALINLFVGIQMPWYLYS